MNALLPVLLVAMATACHATCNPTCPSSWTLHRGSCYRYIPDRMTWDDAEAHCASDCLSLGQAHLASVHSAAENEFVYQLFREVAGDTPDWHYDAANHNDVYGVWLGLHQKVADGPWVYTDGSEVDYLRWKSSEPNNNYYNNLEVEDCVHIWRINDSSDSTDSGQQWNDMFCEEPMSFVCKMAPTYT